MSPLKWTSNSTRTIAEEWARDGSGAPINRAQGKGRAGVDATVPLPVSSKLGLCVRDFFEFARTLGGNHE